MNKLVRLFSSNMTTKITLSIRHWPLMGLILIVLSGCVGGDGESDGLLGGSPPPADGGATPTPTPSPGPGGQGLEAPEIFVSVQGDSLAVSWDEAYADSYRVLYWREYQSPGEFVTNGRFYTTPSLASGRYTVIVEAYDELGNSSFSEPTFVEVML